MRGLRNCLINQLKPSKSAIWMRTTFAILSVATLLLNPDLHGQSCVSPPSGLISWWRAENDAKDFVGGNHGTTTNGTGFTSGEVGQAFNFNGTTAYVLVPAGANLKLTNAMTVEAWINHNGSGNECIMGKGLDSSGPIDWQVAIHSGHLCFDVYASGVWQGGNFPSTMATGTWYHVAVTYDGSSLKGYINGTLDGTMSISGPLRTSDSTLRIGAYSPAGGAAEFFSGKVDELSLYNRALSISEIQSIYNAGVAGKGTQPFPPGIISNP